MKSEAERRISGTNETQGNHPHLVLAVDYATVVCADVVTLYWLFQRAVGASPSSSQALAETPEDPFLTGVQPLRAVVLSKSHPALTRGGYFESIDTSAPPFLRSI